MYILNGTVCHSEDLRPSLSVLLRCVIESYEEPSIARRNRRIPEQMKNFIYYDAHSGQFTIAEIAMRYQVNKNTVIKIRDDWKPRKKRSPRKRRAKGGGLTSKGDTQ